MTHWYTKLVLFLLLGAILNVAVAWGCALWSEPTSAELLSAAVAPDYFTERQLLERPLRILDAYVRTGVGRPFHEMSAVAEEPLSSKAYLAFLDTGWPALALRVEWRAKGDESADLYPLIRLHSGFEIESRSGQLVGRAFGMPSRPIWPGFAINTIFYATILWMSFLGPFVARRFIRRRRKHCVKCGYDLRGAEHEVCPECGVQLPLSKRLLPCCPDAFLSSVFICGYKSSCDWR